MVNKIISFSAKEHYPRPLLVYADLNLQADPAPIVYKTIYGRNGELSYLASDNNPNPVPITDLLLGNIEGTEDESETANGIGEKILLFDENDIKNDESSRYNEEQRKKAHFKLEKNINVNAIKQSIKNIFSWTPGERIINPEFGSKLRSYLYNGITTYNVDAIIAEVQKNFSDWEPRAQLVSVRNISTVSDTEDNTVQIEIIYSIPSLSPEQYSYVVEA